MAVGDDDPMSNPWTWRKDDLLQGGGDPNAMLELLRGSSEPGLGINADTTVGTPMMPSAQPGNYDLGKQNLTANRLLYSPEMSSMFGVSSLPGDQAVKQGDVAPPKGPSAEQLDAAKRAFYSDDFAIDQATKSAITGEPSPTSEEDKRSLAPLTIGLKDQAKKILDKDVWSNFDPSMMAAVGYGEPVSETDRQIAQWKIDNNLKMGGSAEALRALGIEFPGTGASAPVYQSDAVARGTPRASLVQPAGTAPTNAPQDKTGLTSTVGSEFGEVDNPQRGGYTEAGWNVGKWGHTISGTDTKLIALPPSQLKTYGNINDPKFADNFNSNYEIQVVDPKTGKAVSAGLGDIGPGASTGAGLDMTWGVRQQLGLGQNFKGPVQYRIVKKGSALPDGSTSNVAAPPDATAETSTTGGTTPSGRQVTYIQPLDPRTLKDPAIYGDRNTDEDNLKWARHQTDLYAAEMARAGAPIDTDQYQTHFDSFFKASQDKAKGEAPKDLPTADMDRFAATTSSISLLDDLLAAKKKVTAGDVVNPASSVMADFKAKRDFLVGQIAKAGGNVGTLSDTDVKRAQGALPGELDSQDLAQEKIDDLKKTLDEQLQSTIRLRKAGHYDTSGLEHEYFRIHPPLDQAKQVQTNTTVSSTIDKKAPNPTTTPATPSANAPATPQPVFKGLEPEYINSGGLGKSGTDTQPWWKKLRIS